MNITATDIILIPALLIFFGGFIYGVAFANGFRSHELPRYRWLGTAILVLAAIVGARYIWLMFQPGLGVFYRASLAGRKVVGAHYASLIVPLVLLLIVAGLEKWFKRFSRENR